MGSAFLYLDINGGGGFYLAVKDEAVLPDPIRFRASSLETLDRRWSVFWETIFFNPDDDQLWIEGQWQIPNLHMLHRPHGNNHWGDRINAVSFPSEGPTGDNDNRTILHADHRITVGDKELGPDDIKRLGIQPNHRRLLVPPSPVDIGGGAIRLDIESDVRMKDEGRVCRIRARALDGFGDEVLVPKLALRVIGSHNFEQTAEDCSEVSIAISDVPIVDAMDQLVAIASSPGVPLLKKVVSATRGAIPPLTPNTKHDAKFDAHGQTDRGQDIHIDAPRIQVFHGAEDLVGLSSARVLSTVLIQNNVVKYKFIRPTEPTEYYEVTPGVYTHTLEAMAQQDPSFPSPPFPLAKAVSTVHFYRRPTQN
jgi:hypothetical protein